MGSITWFSTSLPPLTLYVNSMARFQWSKVGVRIPHLLSPRIIPFTVLLGAFEALLVWYWVDLKLGQVLLYAGILALPTIFAGKTALATTGEWRRKSVGK